MTQPVTGGVIDCPHCGVRNRIPVLGKTQQVRCGRCGADLPVNPVMHCNESDFAATVMRSPIPVLVDFWAAWCGPCKMIAPILDDVSKDYAGKLKVAKLNIDENPATPPKYGIRGIPTLMIFKSGNVEATKVGAVSKSQLTAFIDSNL